VAGAVLAQQATRAVEDDEHAQDRRRGDRSGAAVEPLRTLIAAWC
jgi:hypothetical protein